MNGSAVSRVISVAAASKWISCLIWSGLAIFPVRGSLQAQTDSLLLEESVLVGRRNESLLQVSGDRLRIQADKLTVMPMLLGSSDPVRLSRFLPSMQASTELDYGLHIQGSDHSHNLVSSGDVPIYGVAHLLGIYSVFNPSHFDTFSYSTWAGGSNRLGGKLGMELPQELRTRVEGEFSLGLLSAQGSLHVPVGKSTLSVSARRSFINTVYGRYLKIGKMPLGYGFTDVNLTWLWRPSQHDAVWADGYWGDDSARLSAATGVYGIDFKWGNGMGALHWKHDFPEAGSLMQTAYVTAYYLNPHISYTGMDVTAPSSLLTVGYRGKWTYGPWSAGLDIAAHRALPQDVDIKGTFAMTHTPQPLQHGQEISLSAGYVRTFGQLGVDAGLRGLLYHSPDGRWLPDAGPELLLSWDFFSAGKLSARVGIKHQYLMQAGITDLGLPFEFWFLAGTYNDPQHSLGTSVSYTIPFAEDAFRFSAEAYYRILRNQVEYRNGFFDILYSPQSLDASLLKGDGRAFGASVMLQKTSGRFTGWLSYAWGRSLRRFEGMPYEVPSSHERLHELDVVASYQVDRWSFGLTFLAATGNPYTPPQALYILSGHVMVQYGEHNSARYTPYSRLDLSVNYFFRRDERMERGLNLSIYNALGARNVLFNGLSVDGDTFSYSPSDINIRYMPSICYFVKF